MQCLPQTFTFVRSILLRLTRLEASFDARGLVGRVCDRFVIRRTWAITTTSAADAPICLTIARSQPSRNVIQRPHRLATSPSAPRSHAVLWLSVSLRARSGT